MQSFLLTVRLNTPVVLGDGFFTLDALLAALLFEECGDVETAHAQVPLRRTGDLFHGSAAFLDRVDRQDVSFVANLRAAHSLDPELILKNRRGGTHRKIDATRRQGFGAVMNSYKAYFSAGITWYGEGDTAEIERLMKRLTFIGKRRASGFGEVARFELQTGDCDGLTGPFGEPLRPIPVELSPCPPDTLTAEAAWRPPYWHPETRAICHVPVPIQ